MESPHHDEKQMCVCVNQFFSLDIIAVTQDLNLHLLLYLHLLHLCLFLVLPHTFNQWRFIRLKAPAYVISPLVKADPTTAIQMITLSFCPLLSVTFNNDNFIWH